MNTLTKMSQEGCRNFREQDKNYLQRREFVFSRMYATLCARNSGMGVGGGNCSFGWVEYGCCEKTAWKNCPTCMYYCFGWASQACLHVHVLGFWKARAPRPFLHGKGHSLRNWKFLLEHFKGIKNWPGGMEEIAFIASVKYWACFVSKDALYVLYNTLSCGWISAAQKFTSETSFTRQEYAFIKRVSTLNRYAGQNACYSHSTHWRKKTSRIVRFTWIVFWPQRSQLQIQRGPPIPVRYVHKFTKSSKRNPQSNIFSSFWTARCLFMQECGLV